MLDRFKKRRVQANRTFEVVVTEFRTGAGHRYEDETYEEYPFDAYCARTKRRKHLVGAQECVEVGASRSKMSLADVHKEMRPGVHLVEPIEDSEREAILRALWRLTRELYTDVQVFGGTTDELWSRVMTAFILGKSIAPEPAPLTQKDYFEFEKPEGA